MKRFCIYFMLAMFFVSCRQEENITKYNIGVCEYSPAFGWIDETFTYIDKTVVLDFNQDAKNANSTATLQLVDISGLPLNLEEYELFVDGKKLSYPEFIVTSDQKECSLKLRCLPSVEAGDKTFYLKLKSWHMLDVLNKMELENTVPQNIMRCDFVFEQKVNALKLSLIWLGIIILMLITLWFVMFRNIVYPKFGRITKTFIVSQSAPFTVKFTGARLVIISNQKKSQSFWDRLIKGKIIYKYNQSIVHSITLKPARKGILVVAPAQHYQVTPNPINKIGQATIIMRSNNNQKIEVR